MNANFFISEFYIISGCYCGAESGVYLYKPNHWSIIYDFTSRSRIFFSFGDVAITGEGLQNLGLCSALRACEQGGIFIEPYLL
jgi:hypothetical protein